MTGYTVNTGSTTKFSEGWDRVFGTSVQAAKRSTATSKQKPAAVAKTSSAAKAGSNASAAKKKKGASKETS